MTKKVVLSNKYLAGFFDAHGTMDIRRRTAQSGNMYYAPRCRIVGSESVIFECCQEVYGGYIETLKTYTSLNWTAREDIVNFLSSIVEYLIVWREKANLMIEFCEGADEERQEEIWQMFTSWTQVQPQEAETA